MPISTDHQKKAENSRCNFRRKNKKTRKKQMLISMENQKKQKQMGKTMIKSLTARKKKDGTMTELASMEEKG